MIDSERLEKLIDHLKLNPNSFSKSLGYDRSEVVYRVLKGENGISKKLVKDITRIYCNVNESFLLTGEGRIFKSNRLDDEVCQSCEQLKNEILELKDENYVLSKKLQYQTELNVKLLLEMKDRPLRTKNSRAG